MSSRSLHHNTTHSELLGSPIREHDMSGIEVAGIVLAVLPIAVKAAKSCAEGVTGTKKILRTKEHDEVKRGLFTKIWMELVLLREHVRKIVTALPNLSQQRCIQILDSFNRQNWQSHSDVVRALTNHLGDNFENFEFAISQLYHWLNKVLTDQYLKEHLVKDNDISVNQLATFTKASDDEATTSRIKERFYLWRKEGTLKEELKNLKEWRKFIERITETACCRHGVIAAVNDRTKVARPSLLIPQLSNALYRVVTESWHCVKGCTGAHHAKLCLSNEADLHRNADDANLKYRLLLSDPSACQSPGKPQWLETTISVNASSRRRRVAFGQALTPAVPVHSMCSVLSEHVSRQPATQGGKLCFSIEYIENESSSKVFRARNYPRSYFQFHPTAEEKKLSDMLASLGQQLDLVERRKLALELSYGMMTLSGTPWLTERWSKEHISFFYNAGDNLCYKQPLVSSDLRLHAGSCEPLSLEVMHPLPAVLSLGILLLELETCKTIESMRMDEDYVDPKNGVTNENTDFTAAIREAEQQPMLSPKYKEAILACLDEQGWEGHEASPPSMLQEHIRNRIYERVIQRLESDIEILTA